MFSLKVDGAKQGKQLSLSENILQQAAIKVYYISMAGAHTTHAAHYCKISLTFQHITSLNDF